MNTVLGVLILIGLVGYIWTNVQTKRPQCRCDCCTTDQHRDTPNPAEMP